MQSRNWKRRIASLTTLVAALFVGGHAIGQRVPSAPPSAPPPASTFDPFNPSTPLAAEVGSVDNMKRIGATRPGLRDPFRPPVRSPYTP